MKKSTLLNDLKKRTDALIQESQRFKSFDAGLLNTKPSADRWSILECIEHLNLYGDFYLPEFETRILNANKDGHDRSFKSGWFGEYTVMSMLPKDNKVSTMKTFASKDPSNSNLTIASIDRFIKQQERMLKLLDQAQQVNISKVICRTTLPVIRFKLGTTFRFVIYHNERHFWQANNVLSELT